jgi:hypothetical protein
LSRSPTGRHQMSFVRCRNHLVGPSCRVGICSFQGSSQRPLLLVALAYSAHRTGGCRPIQDHLHHRTGLLGAGAAGGPHRCRRNERVLALQSLDHQDRDARRGGAVRRDPARNGCRHGGARGPRDGNRPHQGLSGPKMMIRESNLVETPGITATQVRSCRWKEVQME